MKSMHRPLSILLSLIMIMGVFTVLPLSAGAEKTDIAEKPIILLGDADGDGEVTILDATCIQRTLASLSVESYNETASDTDQDGEVTIVDATFIQRWLASLPSNDSIGKPLDEVFQTKAVPVLRSSLESTETADLRFYADQPNVPYINVEGFYDQFYLVNTDLTDGMTCTRDGGRYTLTNIAGNRGVFDIDADTIDIDDFEKFSYTASTLKGMIAIEKMGTAYDENYPFIEYKESYEPADRAPITLNLCEYGIDLRGDESGVYAPLATVSDIFSTHELYRVVYSGKKLYVVNYNSTSALDNDPDFITDVEQDHPADLADFTYRELCFNIDYLYGQPGQEWVHDDLKTMKLDELLTEKYPEIREKLLSTDFRTFYTGMVHLINGILFDGGHTDLVYSKLFYGDLDLTREAFRSMLDCDYAQKHFDCEDKYFDDLPLCEKAREVAFGDDYYIEQGDTAMISFDYFCVDHWGWKAFYAGRGERPLKFNYGGKETYDTVGAVLSGLERAKQNPAIRNIIIDMSCNNGGNSNAMVAIEWLMTGKGYARFYDRLIQSTRTNSIQFDLNFDGKFDEQDVSPYTDYNYGVLTSNHSFSASNNYPWFMHEHGAMILGQKSSGGACGIRITSAAGVEFACSSAATHFLSDSGENMDFGCPLDADLIAEGENPYANFFDLGLLSEKMNAYFAP